MKVPDDAAIIADMLERQVRHTLRHEDARMLVDVPRLIQFIASEPRLAGLIEDLRQEAEESWQAYESTCHKILDELRTCWADCEADLRRLRDADPEDRGLWRDPIAASFGRSTADLSLLFFLFALNSAGGVRPKVIWVTVIDPFTFQGGRLVLDENQGRRDGPRVIDPAAGLVRFADESQSFPISDLRAVAIVYTQRMVMRNVLDHRALVPILTNSVVLVPRRLSLKVTQLLDALEAGRDPGPGFSVRGAAMMVDEASIDFDLVGDARAGRRVAKAVARTARLPILELYGEFYVWRKVDQLDLPLRERLRGAAERVDPGPSPSDLAVTRDHDALVMRVVRAGPPVGRWLAVAGACFALAVGLAFVDYVPAVGVLAIAAILAFKALSKRKIPAAELRVEPGAFRWLHDPHGGTLPSEQLEMMRVNDATLVLIGHDDELRCDLGSETAALWARRAIEHHLLRGQGPAYR